jgi:glycosyltransferase, family 2
MYDRLKAVFDSQLLSYDYEIIFVDDHSPDGTWKEIENICKLDKKVKGILNAKNFGFIRNVFFTLKQGTGDATFMLFGDLQDPPELLPDFVKKWEEGYKVVVGQKNKSEESRFWYILRTIYYKIIDKLAVDKQIQHYNGYGLYDKSFIEILKQITDSAPYLKGIVSEFAMNPYIFKYKQKESNRGKSGFNFLKLYDVAMLGITSYTKTLMRMATFVGGILGIFSLLFAIFIFINKLLNWNEYPVGTASIIIGIFLIGAIQLFFIGVLGEYILSINTRVLKRPLVVVEKKLNFDEDNEVV